MNTATAHDSSHTAIIRRPHAFRDNLEGILTALILALIIRHYVFEVFQIPTGSMAPTLLGEHYQIRCPNCRLSFPLDAGIADGVACPNCAFTLSRAQIAANSTNRLLQRFFWGTGNRVIVNKFLPQFRAPSRWDIVVFRHGTRNLIKRLIGLPNEQLLISHGDIYVNDKIQRKPPEVQEKAWQLVYDSRYVPTNLRKTIWHRTEDNFVTRETKATQELQAATLTLIPSPKGFAEVEFAHPISDYLAYNGKESTVRVGDLRWDVNVHLGHAGVLRLGITEDDDVFHAVLRFGSGPSKTSLRRNEDILAESAWSAKPATEHHVSFSNVDDRLELKVDGEAVLAYEFENPPHRYIDFRPTSGATLRVEESKAVFSRIRLHRDLYYTESPKDDQLSKFSPRVTIPPDDYFFMGDNTRNSSDSREWGFVPSHDLIGKALVVWWPLDDLSAIP